MSNKGDRTRLKVLEAAHQLFRAHGPGKVTMADVAKASGLTRQAVYLHFPNRTELMLAMMDLIEERLEGPELFGKVEQANPKQRMVMAMHVVAKYAQRVHETALALDLARHSDEAAAAAWAERMALRRKGIRRALAGVEAAGLLRDGWSLDQAVDAMWALTAPRTYTDLVVERRWSLADYERLLVALSSLFARVA